MINNLNYISNPEQKYIAGFKQINKKISYLFTRFEYEEDYYGESDLVYKFTNLHYINLYFYLQSFKDEIKICECILNYLSCNNIEFEDFNYIYNLNRKIEKKGISALEIDNTLQINREDKLNYGNVELEPILSNINNKVITLLVGSNLQTINIDGKALDLENNKTIQL